MKKILCVFMTLLIVLNLTACNTATLEDACNKADEIVASYGRLLSSDLSVTGNFLPEQNLYAVVIYPYSSFYVGIDVRISGALLVEMLSSTNSYLCPELEELFKPHDVTVGFFLFDENGNLLHSVVNNVWDS